MTYQTSNTLAVLSEERGEDDVPAALVIFDKGIKQPWKLTVGLDNAMHSVGAGLWQQGDWSVRSVNRVVQEDARRFEFRTAGRLSFRDDFSNDLRRFAGADAVLGFDIAINALPGALELSMICEGGCQSPLDLTPRVKADG